MTPDPSIVTAVVKRIVDAVHPLRIIMFGSAVRGQMTIDSDIDLLVVMPDGVHRRKTAQYLHCQMFGVGAPIDILVATPSMLEDHKDTVGLIYRDVIREGREIYAS